MTQGPIKLKQKSIIRPNIIASVSYVETNETLNDIITECSKSIRKENKIRHDWVEKVIHKELCKRLRFAHINKWDMHKPEYVWENEMHKIILDFKIPIKHLILTRRPDLVLINKKKKKKRIDHFVDFAVPRDYRVKIKKSEKINKYLHITRKFPTPT